MIENTAQPGSDFKPLIAVMLTALGLLLRLPALDLYPMWTDEALTVFTARWDFLRLFDLVLKEDANPPLYYLYLWLWGRIDQAPWFFRLSSLVAGVGSIFLLYALGCRLRGRTTGVVAGLLLALTPLHVFLSDQARYPALITLLALASAWFLLRLFETGRAGQAIGFALSATAMLYTHYFGYFVVAGFFVCCLICWRSAERKLPLIGAWSFIALAALAWAWMIFRQLALREASGGGEPLPIGLVGLLVPIYFSTGFTDWSLPQLWPNLLLPGDWLAGHRQIAIGALLAAPLFGLALVGALSRSESRLGRWLPLCWFLVPLSLMFACLLFIDFYKPYYLLPFLPGLLLLVGAGVEAMLKRSRLLAGLFLAVATVIPSVALYEYYAPESIKEDWRQVAQIISEQGRPGDVVVHYNKASRICFSFYEDEGLPSRMITGGRKGVHIVGPGMAAEQFDLIEGEFKRIWLINYYPMRMDPAGLVLRYAAEKYYQLPIAANIPADPRFFLTLYAIKKEALTGLLASEVDFSKKAPPAYQLEAGWYPGLGDWRWISGEASVLLGGLPGAGSIAISGLVNLEFLATDVLTMNVYCNGQSAGAREIGQAGEFSLQVELPEACRSAEILTVGLKTDRTFIPDRILGDGDRSVKSAMIKRIGLGK